MTHGAQLHDASDMPHPEARRPLPNKSFVTLSEALSWIAFQRAMSGMELADWVGMGRDPSEANITMDAALIKAVDRLTDLADDEKIEIRGKFYRNLADDDRDIRIVRISGAALANYRQFDTPGDILYCGRGLAWGYARNDLPAVTDDHYREVTVRRRDLIHNFPPSNKPEAVKPRRGRKPGSGYAIDDEAFFPKMKKLIDSRTVISSTAAAEKFAQQAKGPGTFESKVSRLSKRYKKWLEGSGN